MAARAVLCVRVGDPAKRDQVSYAEMSCDRGIKE
jgi:hypothetical protein